MHIPRTPGAVAKSEREYKKDAALSMAKAQAAKVKTENKALMDKNKTLKKLVKGK